MNLVGFYYKKYITMHGPLNVTQLSVCWVAESQEPDGVADLPNDVYVFT